MPPLRVPPERLRMMPIAWSITARLRQGLLQLRRARPGAGQQLRVVDRHRRRAGELAEPNCTACSANASRLWA